MHASREIIVLSVAFAVGVGLRWYLRAWRHWWAERGLLGGFEDPRKSVSTVERSLWLLEKGGDPFSDSPPLVAPYILSFGSGWAEEWVGGLGLGLVFSWLLVLVGRDAQRRVVSKFLGSDSLRRWSEESGVGEAGVCARAVAEEWNRTGKAGGVGFGGELLWLGGVLGAVVFWMHPYQWVQGWNGWDALPWVLLVAGERLGGYFYGFAWRGILWGFALAIDPPLLSILLPSLLLHHHAHARSFTSRFLLQLPLCLAACLLLLLSTNPTHIPTYLSTAFLPTMSPGATGVASYLSQLSFGSLSTPASVLLTTAPFLIPIPLFLALPHRPKLALRTSRLLLALLRPHPTFPDTVAATAFLLTDPEFVLAAASYPFTPMWTAMALICAAIDPFLRLGAFLSKSGNANFLFFLHTASLVAATNALLGPAHAILKQDNAEKKKKKQKQE